MEKLSKVIGPSPSELPFSDLLTKIRERRARVTESMAEFRAGFSPKKRKAQAKPKKGAKIKDLQRIVDSLGITMDEFLERMKENPKNA